MNTATPTTTPTYSSVRCSLALNQSMHSNNFPSFFPGIFLIFFLFLLCFFLFSRGWGGGGKGGAFHFLASSTLTAQFLRNLTSDLYLMTHNSVFTSITAQRSVSSSQQCTMRPDCVCFIAESSSTARNVQPAYHCFRWLSDTVSRSFRGHYLPL